MMMMMMMMMIHEFYIFSTVAEFPSNDKRSSSFLQWFRGKSSDGDAAATNHMGAGRGGDPLRGAGLSRSFFDADYAADDAEDSGGFDTDAEAWRRFRHRVRPQTSLSSWKREENDAAGHHDAGKRRCSTTRLVLAAFFAITLLIVFFVCFIFYFVPDGIMVTTIEDMLRFAVFLSTLIVLPAET